MAASKATLKAELESLYAAALDGMSEADFADGMATAVDNYIKTFQVQAGITLTTPDTINGVTTGPGTLA